MAKFITKHTYMWKCRENLQNISFKIFIKPQFTDNRSTENIIPVCKLLIIIFILQRGNEYYNG